MQGNNYIKIFFNRIAENYERYQKKNFYYHCLIENVYLSSIPSKSTIIDFGCGTGKLLARLNPSKACAIDFSSNMISVAKRSLGNNVKFVCSDFALFSPQEKYDYAIISNTLEYVSDINSLLSKAYDSLNEDGKIIITSVNPVWKLILRVGNKLHIKTPDLEKNFLTNKDVVNFLEVAGFEIIAEGLTGAVPVYIPFISPFLNFLIRELPLLRQFGSIQCVIAKKRRLSREYACSVIVPCFNEAGNITTIIQKIPKIGKWTELIFVDDGSQDSTADQVDSSLRDDIKIRCISYKPNRGKLYAITAGFHNAKGDILFILDADLAIIPEELRKFYKVMAEGYADFVNGTRFIYPMEGKAMRLLNYFGNKIFCLVVSWIIDQRVSDTLCGSKALFRKDFLHISMGHDPWGDYDLIFGVAKLKLKMREVAVHYQERKYGKSKMKPLKHTNALLKACFWGLKNIKFSLVSRKQRHF